MNRLNSNEKINTNSIRQKKNGDKIEVSIQSFPISLDNDVLGYYVIYRDISELKNAKRRYKNIKNLAQSTLDSLPANIVILDNNGEIRYTNKAWKDFAKNNGISPEKVGIGINYLEVTANAKGKWSQKAPEAYAGIKKIMDDEEEQFTLEYPCHSPNKKRWFRMRVTPFQGEGPFSVVIAHEDITDWKK